MPLHDWSRTPSELFHDFHQTWSIQIKLALNAGILPKGIPALVEQRSGPRESDVFAIESRNQLRTGLGDDGGIATAVPPATLFAGRTSKEIYAARANRIVVKHRLGRILAVIEIVSPGNKDSRAALRDFVDKIIDFLRAGIHVLVIDLFPPTPRDPLGIHHAIWNEIEEREFACPREKTEFWPPTKRAACVPITSSRSASATSCRTCRCSWRTTGMCPYRWNRPIGPLGTAVRRINVWPWKLARFQTPMPNDLLNCALK